MRRFVPFLCLLAVFPVFASTPEDGWWDAMQRASWRERSGDMQGAAAALRDAAKLAETFGDRADVFLPQSLNSLGLTYERMGRYSDAVAVYRRALVSVGRTRGKQSRDYAVLLGNMAGVLTQMPERERAEALVRQAIEIYRALGGPDSLALASARSTLGELLIYRKAWAEAEPLIEKDLAFFEKEATTMGSKLGMALNNLGVVRGAQGRHEEALQLLTRALTQLEAWLGPQNVALVRPLNNLGTAYANVGRNPDAEACYRRALQLASGQVEAPYVYAQLLLNYSELLRREGHTKEAAKMREESQSAAARNARVNGIGLTVDVSSLRPNDR